MANDLNLLPSRAKFHARKTAFKKKIDTFLWIIGGIWVSLLIIVLGLFFVSRIMLNKYDGDYKKGLVQYKALLSDMVLNQQVKYQAKIVGKVLDERFEYGKSIEMVKSLFSEEVILEDINIDSKKEFTLVGSLKDGKLMDDIEDKVVGINSGELQGFKEANLDSVKITNSGWTFEMEVFLE